MDVDIILEDLKLSIQDLVQFFQQNSNPFQKISSNVGRVLYLIEKIFNFGLKDIAFIGTTTYWDYLEFLPKCLPSTHYFITRVKDTMYGPCARGRIWIRMSLNEKSLHEFMQSLTWSDKHTKKYYVNDSILGNEEHRNTALSFISNLSSVDFDIPISPDPKLNDINFWTKFEFDSKRIIIVNNPETTIEGKLDDPVSKENKQLTETSTEMDFVVEIELQKNRSRQRK